MTSSVALLTCDESTARRLAGVLGEADGLACSALALDDGRWQLAVHAADAAAQARARALAPLAADVELAFAPLAAADWVARSLAGLPPVAAGRFVVHGAHDRARVPLNATAIEIEAALAFGTGHHGTTRGCLLALDALAKRRRARCTLDIGTGSGVLAIAAARMFRRPVVAGDIDLTAVAAARGNARRNGVAAFVTFARAAGTHNRTIATRAPYDLIFANILLGPLRRLALPIRRLAASGAYLVLSGLLPAQANAALAIYRVQGLKLARRITLAGWVTLVLRC